MLWSSYNFWCKREYDQDEQCGYEKWADARYHKRSPEIFHELIDADRISKPGVVQPFYHPLERPCVNAGGYYSEFTDVLHRNNMSPNGTLVIASEEMERFPAKVVTSIAHTIGHMVDPKRLYAALLVYGQVRSSLSSLL